MRKTVTNNGNLYTIPHNVKVGTNTSPIPSVTTNVTATTISNSNVPTGISIDPYNVKLDAKQIAKLKKLSQEDLKLLLNKLKAENIYREIYTTCSNFIYQTIEIEKELANRAINNMLRE